MRKSKKIEKENAQYRQLKIYHSNSIKLDINKCSEFYRADLEFHGIGHGTESYTGHVFLNNHDADLNMPKTLENKFVGSYHVFGHGGCFGDVGHCDILKKNEKYDFRADHPLTRGFKRLIITEQLKVLGKQRKEFTVTIVPIIKLDKNTMNIKEIVEIEKISIVTYE
jgi:hypothetical protein